MGGTGQPADTLVDVIRRHGICPRDQMCDPPIPGSADCDGCIASEAALDAVAAELAELRQELARLYDAVDEAQRFDNTGGDSAVSVVLWSWAERRSALAGSVPDKETNEST